MLNFKKIVFVDSESGKEIAVNSDGTVKSSDKITSDEYCVASFYAGLIFAGGLSRLTDFITNK